MVLPLLVFLSQEGRLPLLTPPKPPPLLSLSVERRAGPPHAGTAVGTDGSPPLCLDGEERYFRSGAALSDRLPSRTGHTLHRHARTNHLTGSNNTNLAVSTVALSDPQ